MTNINATNFRKNLFDYLNQAIVHNDVINVNTKVGNAVILSEEDYSGLMETLRLLSSSQTALEIVTGMVEPLEDGIEYDASEEW